MSPFHCCLTDSLRAFVMSHPSALSHHHASGFALAASSRRAVYKNIEITGDKTYLQQAVGPGDPQTSAVLCYKLKTM